MTTTILQPTQVPTVVLYDVLREASTRLQGGILALADEHGGEAEREQALTDIVAIRRRVDAVDPTDRNAIAALDAELREAYAALPRP